MRFCTSLDGAGFDPSWPVWQSQSRDPGEEISAAQSSPFSWCLAQVFLEGANQLQGCLEAQLTGQKMTKKRCLGHDRTDARCQLPWPVGVNYPGRWKRGMMGLAFRL